MMKSSILTVLAVIFTFQVDAQTFDAHPSELGKNKFDEVVISIPEKGKNAKKNAYIDKQSKILTEVFTEYWHLESIKYSILPSKEASEYAKKAKRAYFLEIAMDYDNENPSGKIRLLGVSGAVRSEPIEFYSPEGTSPKMSVVFMINLMQYIIENASKLDNGKFLDRMTKMNSDELKTKKLLIWKKDLKTSYGESDIKSDYPYDVEIVNSAMIESSVLKETPGVLILFRHTEVTSSGKPGTVYWIVYNPETGAIVNFASGVGSMFQDIKVTEKTIKKLAENVR